MGECPQYTVWQLSLDDCFSKTLGELSLGACRDVAVRNPRSQGQGVR